MTDWPVVNHWFTQFGISFHYSGVKATWVISAACRRRAMLADKYLAAVLLLSTKFFEGLDRPRKILRAPLASQTVLCLVIMEPA